MSIPELKGIQWIPGAGQSDVTYWPEVYRKIRDAGKFVQFYGGVETFEKVVGQLGSGEGMVFIGTEPITCKDDVIAFLKKYGAY